MDNEINTKKCRQRACKIKLIKETIYSMVVYAWDMDANDNH